VTRNLGIPERIARIVVGLMLLGLFGALEAPWKYVTLIGLLPLGTGLLGHCPVYQTLGWRRAGP
jgi:Protein of unknown function (DUF2892)